MGEEQDNLARNLPSFFQALDGSGIDWHIGVTTTDGGTLDSGLSADAGVLRRAAGYRFLTQEVPRGAELFEMLVRVGLGGSGDEMGLLTAFRALQPVAPAQQQANRGFYREDAALHVIVISDEDDSTPDTELSPFELSTFLTSLKSDPDIPVTFNSIVGPRPSGCHNRDTDAAYGSRYAETTLRVGGIERSICSPDWSPVLQELGLQAAGQRQEFFLTRVPAPGTITVRVLTSRGTAFGVEVPTAADVAAACAADGRPGCFGFVYDGIRNSVALVGMRLEETARVRIRYVDLSEATGDLPQDTDRADSGGAFDSDVDTDIDSDSDTP
jgi:hypothetical protein